MTRKKKSDPEKQVWCEPQVGIRVDLRDVDLIAHVRLENDSKGATVALVLENSGGFRVGLRLRHVTQCDALITAARQARKELLEVGYEADMRDVKAAPPMPREWDGAERREKERRGRDRGTPDRRKLFRIPEWLGGRKE
jgi:hypothetical protein